MPQYTPSFIIDNSLFQAAMQRAGFKSIQQLAERLHVHRNTIHHFLAGAPVFPDSLSKMFSALNVEPHELLRRDNHEYGIDTVAPLVDALLESKKNMCIVLFGSRARGAQRRFSDFDLGVYSREAMSHDEFLHLLDRKEDLVEDLPVGVDLVNLNRADRDFLTGIKGGIHFLGGRLSDWLLLKRSIDGQEAGRGN